jgi:cytochrome P450
MLETAEDLPDLPIARDGRCPFNPPPGLYELREAAPVVRVRIWNGDSAWLVTRYEDQRAVLADDRVSVDTRRPGFPYAMPTLKAINSGARLIMSMDDPEHRVLRRMLAPEFMIRRMNALRPQIQHVVDQLVDDMLAGPRPVDLVRAFSLAVPSVVISEMLGVPYEDHDFFQRLSDAMLSSESESRAAGRELNEYLGRLADAKRAAPADDVISRLAQRWENGELTREEVVSAAHVLLVGGHETTANMITLSTAALLRHPDQLAEIRESDDPAFIQNAVEELLRYLHVAHLGLRRIATADIEVAGQLVRAGEGLILSGSMSDRDPAVVDGNPDELDIHRKSRQHVAFGYGIHQCLGQPLVRAELQIVFATLFRRIPTLALAIDVGEISFKTDRFIYGIHELPVTW